MSFLTDVYQVKQLIYAKKYFFLLLVLWQLIVLVLFAVILAKYQLILFTDLQSLLEPLQQNNLDQNIPEIRDQTFSQMLPLLQGYQQLVQHSQELLLLLVFLYLIGHGSLWLLTFNFWQRRSWMDYGKMAVKFLAVYAGGLLLAMLLLSLLSSKLLSLETMDTTLNRSLVILTVTILLIYYLFLTAVAQIAASSWRDFIKQLRQSWRQPAASLLLFLGIITGLILCFYFLFKVGLISWWWSLLIAVVMIFSLVFCRILWIYRIGLSLNNSSEINRT